METEVQESQLPLSDSQEPASSAEAFGEQTLDQHLDAEKAEIEKLDEANKETDDEVDGTAEGEGDEDAEAEGDEEEEYSPNAKYKILDEEHEFDPKLKGVLNKETEPIIRELYEKAHGIDAIKRSREKITAERDETRAMHQGLMGEVGRVLNYKKSGDLASFFEAVQLDDNTIAKYILEKAQIAQLPPEQQAVYNERETFRKRMNVLEQNVQNANSTQESTAVQARIAELDSALGDSKIKSVATAFEARNGAGSFKQAVMEHAAAKWYATKKDLSAQEAVESFVKMTGFSAPKAQPRPGPNATKRVVSRPKVQTIPNYGGGQASVTTQKPKSVADLRKIVREKYGR